MTTQSLTAPVMANEAAVKERPILFSATMVRAILSGAKTQTRRVAGLRKSEWPLISKHCPHGQPGDRLWVRETHAFFYADGRQHVAYQASCKDSCLDYVYADGAIGQIEIMRWRPSIHMPRNCSRILLEITEVRVERLQAISEDDAKAEGVRPFAEAYSGISIDQRLTCGRVAHEHQNLASFAVLWDDINGDSVPWKSNPWVWVVSFKRVVS